MSILFTKEGKNLVVWMAGEIDHHKTEDLRSIIDKEFLRSRAQNIIFDFSDVSFMDSSGIGMMIGRYKLIEAHGGEVVAANPSEAIARILNISGLLKIMKIYKSAEEAIAALERR